MRFEFGAALNSLCVRLCFDGPSKIREHRAVRAVPLGDVLWIDLLLLENELRKQERVHDGSAPIGRNASRKREHTRTDNDGLIEVLIERRRDVIKQAGS